MEKEISLYEAFKSGAESNKNAPSVLYMNKHFSYAKTLKKVDMLALALSEQVKKGEVVIVALPNIPQSMYCIYAINKLGAICYLMHPLSTSMQIEKALKLTESKTVFALDTACGGYCEACGKFNAKLISCSPCYEVSKIKSIAYSLKRRKELKLPKNYKDVCCGFKELLETSAKLKNKEALITENLKNFDCQETAVLLGSGGTSGEPKIVELSSFALNALCSNGLDILNTDSVAGKYMLSPLPLFHGFGLSMGLHAFAMHGGCNVFLPKFNRKEAVNYVRKGKINYMIGVPAVFSALLSSDKFSGKSLKNLDAAFVGGDFVPEKLLSDFNNRMMKYGSKGRLFEGYGLTETSTVICMNTHRFNKPHTVGKPVKNVEIKAFKTDAVKEILSGENTDNSLCGELCVRGETLMRCYYKDVPSSRSVLFTDEFGQQWLKSGDYGYVDKDGFVHFKQRLKRIIKVSGVSVFPSEIEQIVMRQEGVKNACCYDVPDIKKGSKLRLAVATDLTDLDALKAKITANMKAELPPESLPNEIDFLKSLPLTKMNKIDINAIKEMQKAALTP